MSVVCLRHHGLFLPSSSRSKLNTYTHISRPQIAHFVDTLSSFSFPAPGISIDLSSIESILYLGFSHSKIYHKPFLLMLDQPFFRIQIKSFLFNYTNPTTNKYAVIRVLSSLSRVNGERQRGKKREMIENYLETGLRSPRMILQ